VPKCIDYFDTHCDSLEADDTAGECHRPIVQNSICMNTAVNSVVGMGDSRDYLGCSAGFYLLNFVCISCVSTPTVGLWVDY
jgi:hypothetical protein